LSDFNLGDFIETLPYEGGPGSADEYIANNLLSKRLNLRNEELKSDLVGKGKTYLAATNESHYINVSSRDNYAYSPVIQKLEEELKKLRATINAKKKMEEATGIAKPIASTSVLSVNRMTDETLRKIKLYEFIEETDDDL
jgi:hypothetical protein